MTAAPAGAAAHVVGVGEFAVAAAGAPGAPARLATYALGSCVGVALYDAQAGVAGLLHAMLPASGVDGGRAARAPAVFVDTGVPLLFQACYRLGARKERLVVRVVGGARQAEREEDDRFRIGRRNLGAFRALLGRNGVRVHAEATGGARVSRTVYLDVGTGALCVRATGPDGLRSFLL